MTYFRKTTLSLFILFLLHWTSLSAEETGDLFSQAREAHSSLGQMECEMCAGRVEVLCPAFCQGLSYEKDYAASFEEAQNLLVGLAQLPALAPQAVEFGCTDRADAILALLREKGYAPQALGRVSLVNPDLSEEGLRALNSYIYPFSQGLEREAGPFGSPWVKDPLLQSQEKYEKIVAMFPIQPGISKKFPYQGWELEFQFERKIRIGPYQIQFGKNAVWPVGHIAATLKVKANGGWQRMVLDPALSPQQPLTLEEWKSLQNFPQGILLASSLGKKPNLFPEYLTPDQAKKASSVLAEVTKDASWNPHGQHQNINLLSQKLASMNEEQVTEFYNRFFNIKPDSVLDSKKWSAYSLAGSAKGRDGIELPDWDSVNPQSKLFTQRKNRAFSKLAPLVAYQQFLQSI